jgi:hypothetical protein
MFRIELKPVFDRSTDGARMGQISIGDFTEEFSVIWTDTMPAAPEKHWRKALENLIGGTEAVALLASPNRAWIAYRVGNDVFVQDQLIGAQEWPGSIDALGQLTNAPVRKTISEDGQKISEWRTSIHEIKTFLASVNRSA